MYDHPYETIYYLLAVSPTPKKTQVLERVSFDDDDGLAMKTRSVQDFPLFFLRLKLFVVSNDGFYYRRRELPCRAKGRRQGRKGRERGTARGGGLEFAPEEGKKKSFSLWLRPDFPPQNHHLKPAKVSRTLLVSTHGPSDPTTSTLSANLLWGWMRRRRREERKRKKEGREKVEARLGPWWEGGIILEDEKLGSVEEGPLVV